MIEKFYMVTYSTLPMQMGFASEVKGWSVTPNPVQSSVLFAQGGTALGWRARRTSFGSGRRSKRGEDLANIVATRDTR
jgi:hypothetical protein